MIQGPEIADWVVYISAGVLVFVPLTLAISILRGSPKTDLKDLNRSSRTG